MKLFINSKIPNNAEISNDDYTNDLFIDLEKFKEKILNEHETNPENFRTPKKGSKLKILLKYDSQIIIKLRKLEKTWNFVKNYKDLFALSKISKNITIIMFINLILFILRL